MRDERVSALTRQVDELSVAGTGDHELTQLRKSKHDLETKIKDQVSELFLVKCWKGRWRKVKLR